MATFGCGDLNSVFGVARKPQYCIYKGISRCDDHVSQFICNAHARIHQLYFRRVNMVNGENDEWDQIQTYVIGTNNFTLPMFKSDEGNAILMSEINNFAIRARELSPSINVDELATRISCLMGMNMNDDLCKVGGWLSESSSYIMARKNDTVVYFKSCELPKLHLCLLYYTLPQITRNVHTGRQVYCVDNLTLTYDENSKSFSFVVNKKALLLKHTSHVDCVATPLVLTGVRNVSNVVQDQVIRPMYNDYC